MWWLSWLGDGGSLCATQWHCCTSYRVRRGQQPCRGMASAWGCGGAGARLCRVPGQAGAVWPGPSSAAGWWALISASELFGLAYLPRRESRFSARAPPPFVRRSPARACPALRFKFRARLGGAGLGVLHPVGCTEPRCPSATGCGHRTGALGPLYAGCRYAGQCGYGHSELMSHGGLALHAPERDRLWHVGDTSTGAERGFRGLSLHREVCRADADPRHRLYPHRLRAGGGRT